MNRDSYNKIAHAWGFARNNFFGREREYIDAILSALPNGSTILDVGCGTGRPMAEYIISQGHHIVGVDQSEEMLAIARESFPNETWILSPMETYEPQIGYQGALIWDSLFHVLRTEHEPIISKVVGCLPSGGRIMLTVGGSAHPAFTDFMYGQEFYYDSNTPEETENILISLGCRLKITEYMNVSNVVAIKVDMQSLQKRPNPSLQLMARQPSARMQAALGIHRFLLRPSARNPRAVRAYQKAGFEIVPMSVRQQVETYGPGDYEDTLVMICQLPVVGA